MNISWKKAFHHSVKLAQKLENEIKAGDYPFVVPVLRGGSYPGDIVSKMYGRQVHPLHYSTRDNPTNQISQWVKFNQIDKNCLIILVDDLVDSGKTLLEINKELLDYGYSNIYNAVLFKRHNSPVINNLIYVEEIKDDSWLIFPWE